MAYSGGAGDALLNRDAKVDVQPCGHGLNFPHD